MSENPPPPPPKPPTEFMTYTDFKQNAKPSSVFAEAVEELRKERAGEVIDPDYAQANETWNALSHQVVGQERF